MNEMLKTDIEGLVDVKKEDAIPLPIQEAGIGLSWIVPILCTEENGMDKYLARLITSIKSNTDLFENDC